MGSGLLGRGPCSAPCPITIRAESPPAPANLSRGPAVRGLSVHWAGAAWRSTCMPSPSSASSYHPCERGWASFGHVSSSSVRGHTSPTCLCKVARIKVTVQGVCVTPVCLHTAGAPLVLLSAWERRQVWSLQGPLYRQRPSLHPQADGLGSGLSSWYCCFLVPGGQ